MEFKELNKLAWKIRRIKAFQYKCGVMEISWKHCLEMAKIQIEKKAMRKQTQVDKHFKTDEVTTNCLVVLWAVALFVCLVMTGYGIYIDNPGAIVGMFASVGCFGGLILAMADKSNISVRKQIYSLN